MSYSIRLAAIPLALVATASCKETNADYCEGHPEDLQRCPAPDASLCTLDEQCPGQVCDESLGACVACTATKPQACTGTTPVCGTDQTCQPCTAHAQCAESNVCLPTGACASASDVAYVSASGSGTACMKASPCPLLESALARNLPYVKIAADGAGHDTGPVVIDGKAVTILAEPGATLDRDGDGPILEVKSANADVSIYDLEITGATTASGDGILLTPNGGDPKLYLTRVTVDNNQGAGISSTGGTLTVTQSTVSTNQGGGISVAGGGATFTITNNFIYRNGNSTTATVGGASLAPLGTSVFEFNTVVDNEVKDSSLLTGGVYCDSAGFMAPNNVIARNFVNNDAGQTNSNKIGQCTYPTSVIAPNVSQLLFASPDTSPYSYKLLAGSSAIDQATTSSPVTVDFDGDTRPQGAQKDSGADEYKP